MQSRLIFDHDAFGLTKEYVQIRIKDLHREMDRQYVGRDRESRHLCVATLILKLKAFTGATNQEIAEDFGCLSTEMIKSLSLRRTYASDARLDELYEYLIRRVAIAIIVHAFSERVQEFGGFKEAPGFEDKE